MTQTTPTAILNNAPRWSHPPGNQVVPSPWQATYGILLIIVNGSQSDFTTTKFIIIVCDVGVSVSIVVDLFLPIVFGSVDEMLEYGHALRTGDLPEGADLHRYKRRICRSRLALTGAAILGYPYLVLGIAAVGNVRSPLGLLTMWSFVVAGVLLFGLLVRRVVRLENLSGEVNVRFERDFKADETQTWLFRTGMARPSRLFLLAIPRVLAAFLTLMSAALVLHDSSLDSHLKWIALGSFCIGATAAGLRIADPRMRVNPEKLSAIVEYDRAYMTGAYPAHFDADDWRHWLAGQRRSDRTPLVWAALLGTVGYVSALNQPSGFRWAAAAVFGLLSLFHILIWAGRRVLERQLARQIMRLEVAKHYG